MTISDKNFAEMQFKPHNNISHIVK